MRLDVRFSEGQMFTPLFQPTEDLITLDFGSCMVIGGGERYTGEYEVTPHDYEQTLECKEKMMSENVTVFEIPYAEVLNLSGGYTATIA